MLEKIKSALLLQDKNNLYALALLASAVFAWLIYSGVLLPLHEKTQANLTQLRILNDQLAQYHDFSLRHSDYAAWNRAQQETLNSARRMLPETLKPAEAAQVIYEAAVATKVEVEEIKFTDGKRDKNTIRELRRSVAELKCSGDYDNVRRFLHKIENGAPLMQISNLFMQGDENSGSVKLNAMVSIYAYQSDANAENDAEGEK